MSKDKLNKLLSEIIGLSAHVPGTAMSSGGFWEVKSPQQELVENTKKQALLLGAELQKPKPNQNVQALADDLRGSLNGLRSFSVIDDKQLDSLLEQLDGLGV